MDLNQDIIPQICFSIRAGLGEPAAGSGGRRGERDDKSQDRKLLSEAWWGAGPAQHFTSNLTQRHLSVGCETALVASPASLDWPGHNNTSMGYLMVIKLNLMTLSRVKVAILTQILRAPAQFDLHFICLERERECVIKGA